MIVSSLASLFLYAILIAFFRELIGLYIYDWKLNYLYMSAIISSLCFVPFLIIRILLRLISPT